MDESSTLRAMHEKVVARREMQEKNAAAFASHDSSSAAAVTQEEKVEVDSSSICVANSSLKLCQLKTYDALKKEFRRQNLQIDLELGFIRYELQRARQDVEMLNSTLHRLDDPPQNTHTYFPEDSDEEKEIEAQIAERKAADAAIKAKIPRHIRRRVAASYEELEAKKKKVRDLETQLADWMRVKEQLTSEYHEERIKFEVTGMRSSLQSGGQLGSCSVT